MAMLSHSATARGLRLFLYTGAVWGVYNQIASVTSPMMVGFALWLGARDSDIGLLTAFAYLAGLSQSLSFLLTNRVQRKKLFVFCAGVGETTLISAVVFIPFFLSGRTRVIGMIVLVMAGNVMAHLLSPIFNSWIATIIPEGMRARYISLHRSPHRTYDREHV